MLHVALNLFPRGSPCSGFWKGFSNHNSVAGMSKSFPVEFGVVGVFASFGDRSALFGNPRECRGHVAIPPTCGPSQFCFRPPLFGEQWALHWQHNECTTEPMPSMCSFAVTTCSPRCSQGSRIGNARHALARLAASTCHSKHANPRRGSAQMALIGHGRSSCSMTQGRHSYEPQLGGH